VERRSLLVGSVTVETAWGWEMVNAAVDVARSESESERRKNTAFVCIDIIIIVDSIAIVVMMCE